MWGRRRISFGKNKSRVASASHLEDFSGYSAVMFTG